MQRQCLRQQLTGSDGRYFKAEGTGRDVEMNRETEEEIKDGRAGLWMGQLSALGGTGGLV